MPPGVLEAVTAILPALDEEEPIAAVVRGLVGRVGEVLVVDNGSRDRTAERARAAGARVVAEPVRGFGSACHAGLVAATRPVVCFLDADGTFAPADVERICAPVLDGALDLCLGTRTRLPGNAIHPALAAVNRGLGVLVRLRGGPLLTDIGPIRAIRRDALLALGMADRGSAWPLEMVLRASRAGLAVGELPVAYLPRLGGTSKVTGSWRGSARAARQMGGVLLRGCP